MRYAFRLILKYKSKFNNKSRNILFAFNQKDSNFCYKIRDIINKKLMDK